MWKRNSGADKDHITQNQFTAYLCKAVGRRKYQYMQKRAVINAHEVGLGQKGYDDALPTELDLLAGLPPMAQIENQRLIIALLELTDRERYIVLAHSFSQRDFDALAEELDSNYKAISAVYYRAVRKVRERMGGEPR